MIPILAKQIMNGIMAAIPENFMYIIPPIVAMRNEMFSPVFTFVNFIMHPERVKAMRSEAAK